MRMMTTALVVTAVIAGTALSVSGSARAQAAPAPPTSPMAPAGDPASTTPAGPRHFALDTKRSMFVLQVFKEGAAAALAHDHTVHATEMSGEVIADPAAPEAAKVTMTVQTKSLVNDDAQVRKQFGLDPTVPEKDKKAVDESMKGDGQLDVAKYPTISFSSTSVEKNGDKLTLVGDFTLHGVTKKLRMPITVKITDDTLTGDGKVRFLQSDWSIKPYSAFLGAVKNKDEVVLNVHLVAVATK